MPSRSEKKTNFDSSSEGNDGIVKDSKKHDVVDEGSLEVATKSKKEMDSNVNSEGNGAIVKDLKHHVGIDEGILEVW